MTHPTDIAAVNQLPQQIAAAIHRRGLGGLLLPFLEAGRPLAFLGDQALWLSQPVLGLAGLGGSTGRLARLLENPTAVRALIDHLNSLEKGE